MLSMTWPQYGRRECTLGVRIPLSPQMTDLLATLLMRFPRSVPMSDLIEAVYPDADAEPDSAASRIERLIHELRLRVGSEHIMTEGGRGYRLIQAFPARRLAA